MKSKPKNKEKTVTYEVRSAMGYTQVYEVTTDKDGRKEERATGADRLTGDGTPDYGKWWE
jgi:hypothetical protein